MIIKGIPPFLNYIRAISGLGDFLKGQKVPGLSEIKLPAIRGKIGGDTYYSFVTTPRRLLKIAFINHQALNHADGRPAYQRMVSASRIKEIGNFIKHGGYFPTNVLINFSDSLRFDKVSNKPNTNNDITLGWVTLPTRYRSAWIIDGQHRLYGFSRLDDRYLDQSLFVLGFEKMAVRKEADLFITINHKQKSVPRSLLVSLLADIRLGDDDPSTALTALGSAIIRSMNSDKESPLVRRFAIPGIPPDPGQNLTISEAVNGLRRSGLIGERVKNAVRPGPLSGATDEITLERATVVLNAYFGAVRDASPRRWEAGREAFISVNPGIRAHMSLIAEVIKYLSYRRSLDFSLMDATTVADEIIGFCKPVFAYIRDANEAEIRAKFSRRFGEGGVKEYGYYLMQILLADNPEFGSDEFLRWNEQSTSDHIDAVNQFLMKLSERLTNHVINTLKEVHGTHRLESDEQAFWEVGVQNERIRKNAYDAQQRDKKRRKPKEAYLNVIDLMEIVKQSNNWLHFEHVFRNPRPGEKKGQKYYLSWMQIFNELRNIAAHKNQLKTYTDEDLEFVEWLRVEVSPKVKDR
ncbi:MAG: DGQHR domain-containing protein [Gammaproteobacteria bacterium]|nr:DGQHR domain-containing protein [Gammaproteobacteria bacterium]